MSQRHIEEAVQIKVADKVLKVRVGVIPVAKLKELAGLRPENNLEEVVDGRIQPLDDSGETKIQGDEVFVVCGTGAAS